LCLQWRCELIRSSPHRLRRSLLLRLRITSKLQKKQKNYERKQQRATVGYQSFHLMAECVVHALKGLTCRAPGLLAHTEVKKIMHIFSMDPKLRYPTVQVLNVSADSRACDIQLHLRTIT
jgi:hypothetical protein